MPSLEYQISANLGRGEGYIAWRDREPVFCVLAKDQAAASHLAEQIIRDYVERFAGLVSAPLRRRPRPCRQCRRTE